ncbi:MAG: AlpA family phage regulatory protein [Geobacter sp.]|nr:AlpA family phage regulatory protein [Geobacter sp.]
MNRVLRPKEQAALIGLSRATLHRLEKSDPTFPKKIQLGMQAVGRMESDLLAWLESRREV